MAKKKYTLNKNKTTSQIISRHINYHNRARGQFAQDLISVGPRYVFFNSLTSEKNPMYHALYSQAQGYVAQAAASLQQINNVDTGQQVSRMQQYISFIGQMAGTQGDNLNKFLQNMKQKLEVSGMLSDELKKKFDIYFQQFAATNGTNYMQMIALINEVMQQNNKQQEIIDQMYLELGNTIETAIKQTQKAEKETKQQQYEVLEQLFHTNINAYNKEINKVMKQALANSQFKLNYARLLAQKVDGVIATLINDPGLFNIIENIYTSSMNASIESFGNQILGYIIQYLSKMSVDQLSSTNKQDLANEIISSLQNNYQAKLLQISDNFIHLIENQFQQRQKRSKTLEEIVLTTGKGTARLFAQMKNYQQFNVMRTYLRETLNEKEIKYIEGFAADSQKEGIKFTSGKLSRVSALLNKGIKKSIAQQLGPKSDEIFKQIKEKTIQANQVLTKLTNSTNVLASALSVKLSGPSMAEILTGKDFDNEITLAIQSGGRKIKLKNDVNIIINFNEQKFAQNARIETQLKEIAISFQTGFIKKYVTKSGGSQDVAAAAQAYLQQLKEVKSRLDTMVKKRKITRKQANKFLTDLSKMMQTGISVKDYAAGNNLGFHGGTLGANLQSVVNNIETMYQLGGISRMDTDMLYFAIANCSPDAVAFGLKQSIETYLAGAAAMMMFDEGFTAATNFMDQMKQELGGFDSMATVHLFRVQGKLIPAAVVYGTIANKLATVAGQLQSSMQAALKEGGNYVTINNPISRGSIPSYYNMPDPQERWNTVSGMANDVLSGSNISFTFLAGILDILNAIPKAFNV